MIYPRQFLSLCLIASVAVTPTSLSRAAVANPLLRLNASQAGDFHQAVTALAEQGHVALVAEGVPLHPHLSPQDAAKLTAPATLDDEVRAVAAAYDYSAQRAGSVFVLKKRYSDPDDLPALTQAECEHSLMLMQQMVAPFNPHALSSHFQLLAPPGPNLRRDQVRVVFPLVNAFATSLKPDQLASMNTNRLLISSLSQDQQKIARQLQLSLYLQEPIERMAPLLPELKQAEQSAVFCWQDTETFRHVFGFTLPKQTGDSIPIRFQPLSRSTGLVNFNVTIVDFSAPKAIGPDPTDPASLPVQAETPAAQTLADAVAAINALPGGTTRADVDASVAAKPVTLAGAGNAPADQVLHALAEVYGLHLSDPSPAKPGSFTLTLPDVPPPSELAALPLSLRQALPEPFARATHLDRIVAEEQQFYDFWQTPRNPKHPVSASHPQEAEETQAELEQAMRERRRANSGNAEFESGLKRIKEAKAALPTLHVAASRRLRALVEPKLRAKPDGVALADLGEPEHEAVALIFLIEAVHSLGRIVTGAVPDTVLHFDQATLGGGIHENANHSLFTVQFHMPNPPGGLEIGNGGMTVPYYKDSGRDSSK